MTAVSEPAPTAVGPVRRVSPRTTIRNTLTLTWRSLVQIKHNPMELLDLSIQPIMFVLLFAYVFGPAMSGSVERYLPILIPGIIVQNAMFATMSTGFGLNVDITKGVFDRFRSLPIARTAPLAGRILADVAKQAWSMAVVLTVGIIMGFRIGTSPLAVLPTFGLLLAFALLLSWASVFIGLTVSEPEKVQIFGFMIIFPLSFLSSAFIPLSDKYPHWLYNVMYYNPVSQMASATRGLLVGHDLAGHGQPVVGPAVNALLWGLGIAAVFIPLSLRAFRRRV
ncbi:MAG: Transport permease protein [Streptosporangiaceae bacterium]|jgi:oleandomycin transport system permease protein|nr:Transport permease protein [Streptosporangiaceae bacterium]